MTLQSDTKLSPWKAPNKERKNKLRRTTDYCQICNKPLYRIRKTICKECQKKQPCTECGKPTHKAGFCRKHFDIHRFNNRCKCKKDGCNNKAIHTGLCSNHYEENKQEVANFCSHKDCKNKQSKRGLCGTHYQQWRRSQPKKNCSIKDCENKHFKHNLCFQHWSKENPEKYFLRVIRTRITNSINMRYKKNDKAENLLGCSISFIRSYLESKFKENMSWENFGEWHLDHICPCSQAYSEEELIKLQHYSNLAPLWATENFIKNNIKTVEAEDMCKKLLGREWIYQLDS